MKLVTRNIITLHLGRAIFASILTSLFMYLLVYKDKTSIFAGLCIGFFIYIGIAFYTDFFEKRFLRKTNLIMMLLLNVVIQVLIIFCTAWIFVWLFYLKADPGMFFLDYSFLINSYFIVGTLFGLTLSFFFNFYSIVSTLVGPHILRKLLFGLYRNPKETSRVFMFLDITSSTTIAEQIGHVKFMSLVNDFFFDLAEPVQKTNGEIYKYVGDEAIITWKMNHAVTRANCINCFFLMDELINERRDYYLKKYGLVPGFKAGLHGGIAITGQVGYIKREIAYMGDVLNTTARIEEACKTFGKRFLVSEDLINQIQLPPDLIKSEVGNVKLRGKEKELRLFSVEKMQAGN